LLRNRSIDSNRHLIRIQKKHLEQTDSDFRQRTIQIISQVQAAYWNLVFALRNQQNQLDSLNVARQNMRNIEAQIAAGAKAPLDRAQVQTDIATRESNLFIATQNVSTAENTLKQLMLRDPQSPDWSAQLMPTHTPLISGNAATSTNAFLLSQIQDIQRRAAFPVATVPTVSSSGIAPNLVGGYGKDLANLFGFGTRNITVGVAISLPFHNKTAEANL